MSSITGARADGKAARSDGKGWAYAGAVTGGVVSVAANVAHSFRPPTGAPPAWGPQVGAVLLAAFWPCALLLAVEILARVAWPAGRWWTALRYGGVTPVAAVAAIVSYRHLSGLLDWYGEDPITVTIGPAAVDGLMVISTAALLALVSVRALEPGAGFHEEDQAAEAIKAAFNAGPQGVTTHPSGEPSIPDGSPIQPSSQPPIPASGSDGPTRVDGFGLVATDRGWVEPGEVAADGSASAGALHLIPWLGPDPAETAERPPIQARADDLERAQQAIKDGTLRHPLTADAIRRELRIGLTNARAVRDVLSKDAAQA